MRPAQAVGSIDYLMRTFGVGRGEAIRRLELQRTAATLDGRLAARSPASYAGSWIDQARGGVLDIGATNPAEVKAGIDTVPDRAHINVIKVVYSRSRLLAAAGRIAARLGLGPGREPFIDDEADRVVVPGRPTATATALGPDAGLVKVVTPIRGTPTGCSLENCTPPMRGGLKLYFFRQPSHTPTWVRSCTNGFNMHASNGWQYMATAGHCYASEGIGTAWSDDDSQWVGAEDGSTYDSSLYPDDGVIMPYYAPQGGPNQADYWLKGKPSNRVWDAKLGNPLFPIKGEFTNDQIKTGFIACRTGAVSLNTVCGSVRRPDTGIVMDIPVKKGDSGGPLFSEVDNKAYGIESGGLNSLDPPVDDSFAASTYTPLSNIEQVIGAKTGLTFAVNTS